MKISEYIIYRQVPIHCLLLLAIKTMNRDLPDLVIVLVFTILITNDAVLYVHVPHGNAYIFLQTSAGS